MNGCPLLDLALDDNILVRISSDDFPMWDASGGVCMINMGGQGIAINSEVMTWRSFSGPRSVHGWERTEWRGM